MELHVLLEMDDREEEAEKEVRCSWCRSRGLESVGHVWKECERLTEFKMKQRRQRRERRERKQREREAGRGLRGSGQEVSE